jgi:hypothetical protein
MSAPVRTLRRATVAVAALALVGTSVPTAFAATPTTGTPVGNVDVVAAQVGQVLVKGWAWDPDTTAPVVVTVTIGAASATTTATVSRPDVARVFPTAGPTRGFVVTVPVLAGGTQNVCVTATNVGAGVDKRFACRAVTLPGVAPVGHLDSATESGQGIQVTGWAADRDDLTRPVPVTLVVDGAPVASGPADRPRADVQRSVAQVGASTGFTFTVPAAPGDHEVCAVAQGLGTGGDTALPCATVTVRDHSPVGAVTQLGESAPNTLAVTGWARDIDATGAVQVRLSLNGAAPVTVEAAGSDGAFSGSAPVRPGQHQVCATVVNVGPGTDVDLGCTVGTVVDHDPQGLLASAIDATDGGIVVTGVATDVDAPGATTVRTTLDGVAVTPVAPTRLAASAATDATTQALASDPGRFAVQVPAAPGDHRVCVTAVNVGPGTDVELGCMPVKVIDHAALGKLEKVTGAADGLTVSGWAADRDASTGVTVALTVDGVARTLTTGAARPDIASARPDLGASTGFGATIPASPGSHKVCAVVRNVGPGADADLGCLTASVPAPAPVRPGPTNTGVPAGTALTVHNGDYTVTTAGAVVQNLDIRGYLRIKAANVTVKNTIVRGRPGLSTAMALVQSSSPGVTITDSTLVAAQATPYIDGFVGSNVVFTRVDIHGVVDSVKLTGGNIVIQDSWLHDNLYYNPVPWNANDDTHSDNLQIGIGSNVTVRNSVLTGTHNAALMITQDRGPVSNVTIQDSWLDNGTCTINLAEKAYGPIQGLRFVNNQFGTAQVKSYCAVIAKSTTSSISTFTNNVFTDGTAFKITRG